MRAAQEPAIKQDVKLFPAAAAVAWNGRTMDHHVEKSELGREENDGPFFKNKGRQDKRQGERQKNKEVIMFVFCGFRQVKKETPDAEKEHGHDEDEDAIF